MKNYSRRNFLGLSIAGAACAGFGEPGSLKALFGEIPASTNEIDLIAESYVKLALQVSNYDPNYLDTYFGPEEWNQGEKVVLNQLAASAKKLVGQLSKINWSGYTELEKQRHLFLTMQLFSVQSKIDMLSGKKMSFEDEFSGLYGIKAEKIPESHFREIIDQVEKLLPSKGSIVERVTKFRSGFIIPEDKLQAVFLAAMAEARRKTLEHIDLPPGETVKMEFTKGLPYAASCVYTGNNTSIYTINVSVPIDLLLVIYYACHEAYPGHHTYYNLIDEYFRKRNQWIEFSIIPLYSPLELMLEGTAVYTLDLVYTENEKIDFGRKLASLSGLDSSDIELYFKLFTLLIKLRIMARGLVAREFSNGKINRIEAKARYMEYALATEQEASLEIKFSETFRSYANVYYLGWQLVDNYIRPLAGDDESTRKRWDLFKELMTTLPAATIFKRQK